MTTCLNMWLKIFSKTSAPTNLLNKDSQTSFSTSLRLCELNKPQPFSTFRIHVKIPMNGLPTVKTFFREEAMPRVLCALPLRKPEIRMSGPEIVSILLSSRTMSMPYQSVEMTMSSDLWPWLAEFRVWRIYSPRELHERLQLSHQGCQDSVLSMKLLCARWL
jgi:hypothetical protein